MDTCVIGGSLACMRVAVLGVRRDGHGGPAAVSGAAWHGHVRQYWRVLRRPVPLQDYQDYVYAEDLAAEYVDPYTPYRWGVSVGHDVMCVSVPLVGR
jgi:hypothetical protein